MTINTFDNQSTARIGRVVRSYEKSVLGTPNPTRRRIPLSGGGGDTIAPNPFLVSIAGNTAFITSGSYIIKTQDDEIRSVNAIPSGSVDLSELTESSTIYIYAKISTQWLTEGKLNEMPAVTINTDSFFFNTVRFPATDISFDYRPIAQVELTVTEGVKTYDLAQIAYDNFELIQYNFTPWKTIVFWKAKEEDTDDDTEKVIYLKGGITYLPDGSTELEETTSDWTGIKLYGYINISATLNNDEWLENYTPTLVLSDTLPVETEELYYYKVSEVGTNGEVSQTKSDDYYSNARIY